MGRSLLTLFHPGKLAMKICQRRDDLAFGFWLSLSQSPASQSHSHVPSSILVIVVVVVVVHPFPYFSHPRLLLPLLLAPSADSGD